TCSRRPPTPFSSSSARGHARSARSRSTNSILRGRAAALTPRVSSFPKPRRRIIAMDVPSYFKDFLGNIRPTATQRDAFKNGHRVLRARLANYGPLKNAIVSSFLQGSYRRATAVRPQGERRPDVDIIVVTGL